jgi:hypothetical protein
MTFLKVCFATLAILAVGYGCALSPALTDVSQSSFEFWVMRVQLIGLVVASVIIIYGAGRMKSSGQQATDRPKARVYQFPNKRRFK